MRIIPDVLAVVSYFFAAMFFLVACLRLLRSRLDQAYPLGYLSAVALIIAFQAIDHWSDFAQMLTVIAAIALLAVTFVLERIGGWVTTTVGNANDSP